MYKPVVSGEFWQVLSLGSAGVEMADREEFVPGTSPIFQCVSLSVWSRYMTR